MIATVVSVPIGDSPYATARDEHGMNYTIHKSELPESADVGDQYAYYVDIYDKTSGSSTTLRRENLYEK